MTNEHDTIKLNCDELEKMVLAAARRLDLTEDETEELRQNVVVAALERKKKWEKWLREMIWNEAILLKQGSQKSSMLSLSEIDENSLVYNNGLRSEPDIFASVARLTAVGCALVIVGGRCPPLIFQGTSLFDTATNGSGDNISCGSTSAVKRLASKTVVIDSVTWLQNLIFAELCKQYGVKSIEKCDGGYSKGYIHALALWEQVLQTLQTLRLEKRMIVLLLGHTEVKKIENPEVTAFDQFLPNLHHKASEKVRQWCDLVLFATREFGVAKGEKSGGERILRCVNSPMCVAKSRYQIPEILPLSWSALAAALYPKKETNV